jgi:hypothetical protein
MKKNLITVGLFFSIMLFTTCQKEPIVQDTRCSLMPDPGLCEAYRPKYYFDQREKKCKVFIWGGCAGVVPFETLEECESCGCK